MAQRFIAGDSYGDVANRQLAYDQARDSRFFNSIQANRAERAAAEEAAYRRAAMAQNQSNTDRSFMDSVYARQAALSASERDAEMERQRGERQWKYRVDQDSLANMRADQREQYYKDQQKLAKDRFKLQEDKFELDKSQPSYAQIRQQEKAEAAQLKDEEFFTNAQKVADLANRQMDLRKEMGTVGGKIGSTRIPSAIEDRYSNLVDEYNTFRFGLGTDKKWAEKKAADELLAPYRNRFADQLPGDISERPFADQLRRIQSILESEYEQIDVLAGDIAKTGAGAHVTIDPNTGKVVSTYARRFPGGAEAGAGSPAPVTFKDRLSVGKQRREAAGISEEAIIESSREALKTKDPKLVYERALEYGVVLW